MTNVMAITGTMHNKVHEWLDFDGEWSECAVADLSAKSRKV